VIWVAATSGSVFKRSWSTNDVAISLIEISISHVSVEHTCFETFIFRFVWIRGILSLRESRFHLIVASVMFIRNCMTNNKMSTINVGIFVSNWYGFYMSTTIIKGNVYVSLRKTYGQKERNMYFQKLAFALKDS